MAASKTMEAITCPLCHSHVGYLDIDTHTAWHQKLLDIVLLLAGK